MKKQYGVYWTIWLLGAVLLAGQSGGKDIQWTVRKTDKTGAYYVSIKDVDTYTVTNVSLEIQPVSLRVKKLR